MLLESELRAADERSTRERGFTLIELLIVIVVLGILAAVIIFALGGVAGKSVVSSCNADAKTVQTAVAAYQAQNSPFTDRNHHVGQRRQLPGPRLPAELAPEHRVQLRHQRRRRRAGAGDGCIHGQPLVWRDVHRRHRYSGQLLSDRLQHRRNVAGQSSAATAWSN